MIQYNSETYGNSIDAKDFKVVFLQLNSFLKLKGSGSIVEYILEFCDTYDYNIEDIADIINENKIFKNILKTDCINQKIFKSDIPEDW